MVDTKEVDNDISKKQNTQKQLRRAFIKAFYQTLDSVVSPTPYLEIVEDNYVDVRFLNGAGANTPKNSTEITVLDVNLASLFFDDFNILWEGVTGTGKSFTADSLGLTICGREGYLNLRLCGGALGTSASEPFKKTVLESGLPKIKIDHESCKNYAILFLDEINTGDFKDTSMVVEGVVQYNGETQYIRMPISDTKNFKKISIIAAMNPSDELHTHANELSIAGENRFLKFPFSESVVEAASTRLNKVNSEKLHEYFWRNFKNRTGLKGSWKELYPLITDSTQFSDSLNEQCAEFIDVCLGYVSCDPKTTVQRNKKIMRTCKYESSVLIRDDNDYQKILKVQSTLKHGMTSRDLKKIWNLSRLISFIKGMKTETYDVSVNVNDICASVGIVLESKTITGTDYGNLITLVNDARLAHTRILKEFNIPESYSLRQFIFQAAAGVGAQEGIDSYFSTLKRRINDVNKLNMKSKNAAYNTIKSRLLADLLVLNQFSEQYENDMKTIFKGKNYLSDIGELYLEKKFSKSLYEHRLGSFIMINDT